MNYWIRAYDHTTYRVDDFIHDNGYIDWGMRDRFALHDIVFLYATSPESRLTHMMEVTAVGLDCKETADDSEYFISQEHYLHWLSQRQTMKYVRFQFLKELTSPALHLHHLMRHGLGSAPRSPRRLSPEVVDYIMNYLE